MVACRTSLHLETDHTEVSASFPCRALFATQDYSSDVILH